MNKSPVSLEDFDVRKDLVLILVPSKSCQNQNKDVIMKLLQRDLKQEQSYNIVQAKSQKQSVIQTILHLGPSVILCSSLL